VGVTGYDVYAGTGSNPVATSTGTSVTVTGLSAQTSYTFSVRARDAAGNTSAASPTVTVTTQPSTAATCRVSYRVVGQSTGSFTANVTIGNTGTATIDGWLLRWTFTAGQRVTNGWGATWSQSANQVTATNLSWNRTITPGASVQIGFQGSWSGSNPAPTSFTLNNAPCTTA
jgi:chitodextrinase